VDLSNIIQVLKKIGEGREERISGGSKEEATTREPTRISKKKQSKERINE
jgi:hypothetical protein